MSDESIEMAAPIDDDRYVASRGFTAPMAPGMARRVAAFGYRSMAAAVAIGLVAALTYAYVVIEASGTSSAGAGSETLLRIGLGVLPFLVLFFGGVGLLAVLRVLLDSALVLKAGDPPRTDGEPGRRRLS